MCFFLGHIPFLPLFSLSSFLPHPFQKLLQQFFPSLSFLSILFIYLERDGQGGRKRGGEALTCERYINWLPLTRPQPGSWPTPRHVPWLGINRTGNPLVHRLVLNSLSHTSQGNLTTLNTISWWFLNLHPQWDISSESSSIYLTIDIATGSFKRHLKGYHTQNMDSQIKIFL